VETLHTVPRFDDSLTYLYTEHSRVDRSEGSLALWDERGKLEVPVAAVRVLMLGPGSTLTHGAMQVLAECNCLVIWCGEELVRFYAHGMGGTRSASRLLHQARLACDPQMRWQVVRRMYARRFAEMPPPEYSIEQLRGMEGYRVRDSYRQWSEATGVPWTGRYYDRGEWGRADPINRALSAAHSCLYGLCQAAILSAGYSPALGFIHTGKQLSFVYDVADLYKTDLSLPVAFEIAKQNPPELERAVRLAMREAFRGCRLVDRIIPDLRTLLADDTADEDMQVYDDDPARPAELWDGPEQAGGETE
jgi:CRISPR-associated protein Cas1